MSDAQHAFQNRRYAPLFDSSGSRTLSRSAAGCWYCRERFLGSMVEGVGFRVSHGRETLNLKRTEY